MTPSLYDLLNVAPDASEDEIRTAWKSAIADLEPSDRRFRAYNDAAGVLLDTDQRASYDAELAEQEREAAPPADEPAEPADDPDEQPDELTDGSAPAAERSGVMAFLTGTVGSTVLGVVTIVALALAIWAATWSSTFDARPKDADALSGDRTSALAAADRIAEAALSYDYRQVGTADIAEKQAVMTDSYAREYAALMDNLRPEIEAQETVVVSGVRGSALAGLTPEGDEARVVVFADQLVQKGGSTAAELRQMATLRLIRSDGEWLLDLICTDDLECDGATGDEPAEVPDTDPSEEATDDSSGAPEPSEEPSTDPTPTAE